MESSLGKGTTFLVYLPVNPGDITFETETKGGIGVRGNQEHILVCEDETSARDVTVRMLVRYGYRVTAAENAAKALEVLAAEPVALLLTDVVMPGMSGPELVALARAQHPALRVLYMSGYVGEALATQELLDAGVNLLQKPFHALDLNEHIRREFEKTSL